MGESDDENFVTFGNALEPLDEECLPRKKPVTIEDQYALDAQGRRRFHGAFTGGFSAGYFNSVGTRDGWRPQQFKSSRSSKAGGVAQRPEDFMDEEDTGEFGIAPTVIRANSDFADHGRRGTKRERQRHDNDGPIPGVPVLQELLKPSKDTVGVTLLKRMGWRPGQGIGPRITKREKIRTRQKNEKVKIYGCQLPNESEKAEDEDSANSEECNEEILFAPDDYEPFICNPKDNYFGIGYTGLDRRPVLSGHVNLFEEPAAFKLQEKDRKVSIRGQAFGVGAFEADDEDIYQRDDMSRYDFSLGPEKKAVKSRWSKKTSEAESSKLDCPEGFVPACKKLERKKLFEAPELPRDFKPQHVTRKSRFYPPIEALPNLENARDRGSLRPSLSASDRARILGDSSSQDSQGRAPETPQSDPKSASPAANIIVRSLNLHGKQQTEERRQQDSRNKSSGASWLDKLSSKSFVSGGTEGKDPGSSGCLKNLRDFQSDLANAPTPRPFLMDPEKQTRFEKFVELTRIGETNKFESIQPLSMTEWERQRECEEFEQASRIFEAPGLRAKTLDENPSENPNDSSLGGRFVDGDSGVATLKEPESLDEQMRNAARMNLFGKLTRVREIWQPANIVCKRFNIPEPRVGCCPKTDKTSKRKRCTIFDSLDFGTVTERFEGATDTAEIRVDPRRPCISRDGEKFSETTESRFSEPSEKEITASSSKSTIKMRTFEASYEKVFGLGARLPESEPGVSKDNDASPVIEKHEKSSSENEIATETTGSTEKTVDKKDLFKAIFLSSSEDSDTDKGEDDEDDSEAVKSLLIGKTPSQLNLQRNTSPPRGIFAKLDLDSLARPATKRAELRADGKSTTENESVLDGRRDEDLICKEEPIESEERKVSPEQQHELPPDVYGPALPVRIVKSEHPEDPNASSAELPKPIFRSVVVTKRDSDGSESRPKGKWVERRRSKKTKKEKHKHKHKEKERSRHKHKSKKDKH